MRTQTVITNERGAHEERIEALEDASYIIRTARDQQILMKDGWVWEKLDRIEYRIALELDELRGGAL